MKKKIQQPIIDSRYFKVLAAKIDDLKDSIVFIAMNDDRYGEWDISQMRELGKKINNIEPSGRYFLGLKHFDVSSYDVNEIKGRDLIITITHSPSNRSSVSNGDLESQFRSAFIEAKSVKFVHCTANKVSIDRI